MITRRKFIVDSGKVVLGSMALPSLSYADFRGNMHNYIAKQVEKKYAKKSLTLLYPKGSLGNVNAVKKMFEGMTSVKLNLKEGSLDTIASELLLESKLKSGRQPVDLALPATFAIPDLVEGNAIVDLSPFAKEFEPSQIREGWLYSLGDFYKGKFYGYQTDGDSYLMFYNSQFLEDEKLKKSYSDRFGKSLEIPKTWSELDQQIAFMNNPEKNQYGGSLFRNTNYVVWEFWIRLHAKGIFPVTSQFVPNIASDQAVQCLEELIQVTQHLEPGAKKNGLFENFASFAEGNKYCNIGWGGTQKYLNGPKSKIKNNLKFSVTPGGEIRGKVMSIPYFNWGWNYVVSSGSKNKELAYLFSLFASTPVVSTASVAEPSGYFDPFIESHYSDKKIQQTYGNDFLVAHKECMMGSIPDFYVRGQGVYMSALKQGIQAAASGHIKPKTALKKVHEKWQKLTEQYGRKSQIDQWKFLKSSYPKNIREGLV